MRNKTHNHIYGYVNLLYYKQYSLVHVLVIFREMFFEGNIM
jgi:hypothetical protein